MTDAQRLDALLVYAETLGWHVHFEATPDEDEACFATRTITIDSTHSRRGQVYHLLHELGHARQRLEYGRLFESGVWGELENELDAWVRGWRVAEELSLCLPPRGYQQAARKGLITYIRHIPGLAKYPPTWRGKALAPAL